MTSIRAAIEQSIVKERGLTTVVVCPPAEPRKTGLHFTCTARLNVGSYPVTVVELNTRGDVKYSNSSPLRVLNSRAVELAIQRAITKERHLGSTVTCPKEILQQKGLVFTCSAKTTHGVGTFTVTEVDNDGHVRFVGS